MGGLWDAGSRARVEAFLILACSFGVARATPAFAAVCLQAGVIYEPNMAGEAVSYESSSLVCQQRCQHTQGCAHFSFIQGSECYLQGADAKPSSYQNVVSGPRLCTWDGRPTTTVTTSTIGPMCHHQPYPGFPGDTAEISDMMWRSQKQPTLNDCWGSMTSGVPRFEGWTPEVVPGNCETVKVLTTTGPKVIGQLGHWPWPGKCSGLRFVKPEVGMTCNSSCYARSTCQSWQLTPDKGDGYGEMCYQGLGYDCFDSESKRATFTPKLAQRLMHGDVFVLWDSTRTEIVGLQKVIPASYFHSHEAGAEACKWVCYSDIGCAYWQYSTVVGCLVEDQAIQKVAYPLTTKDVRRNTDIAVSVMKGEYIQHFCPQFQEVTTTTIAPVIEDQSWGAWGLRWGGVVLFAFCAVAVFVGMMSVYTMSERSRKQRRKTVAAEMHMKDEPEGQYPGQATPMLRPQAPMYVGGPPPTYGVPPHQGYPAGAPMVLPQQFASMGPQPMYR